MSTQLLPRSTGYLLLVVLLLSVLAHDAVAAAVCGAMQAGLLVVAQRYPAARAQVLAMQIAATWLPILVIGGAVSTDYLLAATALFATRRRWRWVVFVLIVVISGVVHGAWQPVWPGPVYVALGTAASGLVLYSLLRLPELLDRLSDTRSELAQATLVQERLLIADRLRAALGDQVATVRDLLADARRELTTRPDQARTAADQAASATRRTIRAVREIATAQRDLDVQPVDGAPIARLVPRLTILAIVVGLFGWTANQAMEMTDHRLSIAIGGTLLSCLFLAGLYTPRYALPLLTAQAVITLLPLPWFGAYWSAWLILLATAVLLTLRGPWAVAVVIALFALRATYTKPGVAPIDPSLWLLLALQAMLALFGLARFWQLSQQLNRSRAELVRSTLHIERLRLARDIHDLLGLTLSVLALKADLITGLITRDPERAAREIDEASRIAADAQSEAHALVDADAAKSLGRELDSARKTLADTVAIVELGYDDELPDQAGAVLAPVLREAITNVLRHSAATRVRIECRRRKDHLHLDIRNDGARRASRPGGQGIDNMRARVLGAGGSFTAEVSRGDFLLKARVPC
ncbi:histidine kinase [Nocardia sp. NPDC046763]|uniref:sensor histidine kinase n=1 Tax=Nocardia sp. NPDC046763 TaxID=3155256 RepID=UPI0033F16119